MKCSHSSQIVSSHSIARYHMFLHPNGNMPSAYLHHEFSISKHVHCFSMYLYISTRYAKKDFSWVRRMRRRETQTTNWAARPRRRHTSQEVHEEKTCHEDNIGIAIICLFWGAERYNDEHLHKYNIYIYNNTYIYIYICLKWRSPILLVNEWEKDM